MSKNLAQIFFIAILSVAIFVSCSQPEDVDPNNANQNGQQQGGNSSGDAAPNFELTALDGTTFKLSEQDDKVVVLFFFGNTCPSCRAVAPDIEKKLNAAYSSASDYVIVGLDQWDGSSNTVDSFKDLTKVTFPLLLNASSVASSFKTTYDRLVVVDKAGKIAYKGSRSATNEISQVMSVVDDLLKDM